MLTKKGLVVVTGLIFWVIAARLYTVDDVGLATAIMSSSTLIVVFSTLGFDVSLVRFLKSYDKSKIFFTCLFLIMTASFVLAALYIFFIPYFSPHLKFIQNPFYAIIFLLFTVISSIALVTDNVFIALRDTKYSFIQNALQVTRVPVLLPLVFLGTWGIIGANFLGSLIAFVYVFMVITRFIPFKPRIDKGFIHMSLGFSFGNYIANIFYSVSFLALPILVLNLMGGEAAGIFYIAFTIGNFLLQVPIALGVSFFVEGIYGENLRKSVIKSGTAMVLLLVPGIVIFWIFGSNILAFFGSSYITPEAIDLLRLVALSSLIYTVYQLFQPLLNIKMQIKALILLNALISAMILGLSYLFLLWFGLIGVGYALIITFIIIDVVMVCLAVRWGWLNLKRKSAP